MAIFDLATAPHHIPILAAWHHRQWQDLNPGDTVELRIARMQSYLGDNLIPSTFIYTNGAQLAGSAAIVECDMDSRRQFSPWLASVYVDPGFRCQGIGSQLVNHVMQQAAKAEFPRLFLFTPDMADFYRRLGWATLSKEEYRGQQVNLMQVDLTRHMA